MTVEATITGRRYLEHRANGAVLVGSRDHDATFTVRWDLVLSDDPSVPWRIARLDLPDPPSLGRWWRATHQLPVELYTLISETVGRPD
jgi:hypothetical protein